MNNVPDPIVGMYIYIIILIVFVIGIFVWLAYSTKVD